MPFFLKYKNWIIAILVILLIIIAYSVYAKKNGSDKSPENSCPNSFSLNPFGSVVPDVASTTYSISSGKYYAQTSGGYGGYGVQLAPKEISKEVFMKACEKYKSQNT